MQVLTTYQAFKKYGLSKGYLRLLLGRKQIKGRQVKTSPTTLIWLIEETSLKAYLKKDRKRGPKPKKKRA